MTNTSSPPREATLPPARGARTVVLFCAVACAAMLGLWGLSWLLTPSYALVASGLTGTDLQEAGVVLDRAGITHRIDVATASAHVPIHLADGARTALADAGLGPSPVAMERRPPRVHPLEQALAADIERLLFVEGGVRATAVVTAVVNNDQTETTRERYVTDDTAALLEQQEHVESQRATADGEVLSRYSRTDRARLNAATRSITSIRKASAIVTRLGVAVVVHDLQGQDGPMPSRRKLRQLVSAAVGADPSRGDTVVVTISESA